MDIGTGLAVIGIWAYPCACALSTDITASGLGKAKTLAITFTVLVTQQPYLMNIFGY